MFATEDIKTLLQEGKTMDDIANMLTQALNDAQAQIKAEQAKADRLQKEKEMDAILADFAAWFHKYYDAKGITVEKLTGAQIIDLIDAGMDYLTATKDLLDWMNAEKAPCEKATVQKKAVKKNPDDVIAEFLTNMGW